VARRFIGQDLFGHIDGGAELFHEFGFVDLLVASYVDTAGRGLDLEVYRMADPRAALGIYLMKCGSETPLPDLPFRHSASPYQLTLLAGDRFIQVNNPGGRAALLPAMAALAAAAAPKEAGAGAASAEPGGKKAQAPAAVSAAGLASPGADALLARLPAAGLQLGSERLLKGPVALEHVLGVGEGDVLGLAGRTWAVLGRYTGADSETETLILVDYADSSAAAVGYASLARACTGDAELLVEGGNWLCFRDWRGRFGEAARRGAELRLRVDLAARPARPQG
jgi:hypothetical protein